MAVTLVYEGEKYDLSIDHITMNESIEIERVTGWTFAEWGQKRAAGSALAMKAGSYVIVKRQLPDLRFDTFDFEYDSVQTDETDGGAVAQDPTPAGDAPAEDGPTPT